MKWSNEMSGLWIRIILEGSVGRPKIHFFTYQAHLLPIGKIWQLFLNFHGFKRARNWITLSGIGRSVRQKRALIWKKVWILGSSKVVGWHKISRITDYSVYSFYLFYQKCIAVKRDMHCYHDQYFHVQSHYFILSSVPHFLPDDCCLLLFLIVRQMIYCSRKCKTFAGILWCGDCGIIHHEVLRLPVNGIMSCHWDLFVFFGFLSDCIKLVSMFYHTLMHLTLHSNSASLLATIW